MDKPTLLALAICGALQSFSSFAQQTDTATSDIEKIEVTGTRSAFGATKSAVPIVELARSVSIETAADLEDKGAFNLLRQ